MTLLCTLYLPTGFFMGMRFTSASVRASKTMSAPSASHRLASA
jgi:hypothetical protein